MDTNVSVYNKPKPSTRPNRLSVLPPLSPPEKEYVEEKKENEQRTYTDLSD